MVSLSKAKYLSGPLLLFALCPLVVAGCWRSDNHGEPGHISETAATGISAPVDQVEHSGKTAPAGETASSNEAMRVGAVAPTSEIASSSRVEHWDETTPADEAAPPSNMGQAHGFLSSKRLAPAPLRLRIFKTTAIVRASLISSSATTVLYSAADGTGIDKDTEGSGEPLPVDGEYRAVHSFRFRVTEYLKGSGASEIVVTAMSLGSHETEALAMQVAMDSLASRDTSRDTHEAILFLWEPTSNNAFHFLWSGPYPLLHYTIDTLNRVWLPAKEPPAPVGVSSSSDNSSRLFLMGDPVSGSTWPTSMSLGELRSEVAAVDALLEVGDGTRGDAAIAAMADAVGLAVDAFLLQAEIEAEDGIEWYRECVINSWRYEHTYGHRQDKPRNSYEDVLPLASGAPAGTVIESYSGPGRKLIEGADKDLFKAVLIDDDDRRDNGFKIGDATARPLPAGTYQYKSYLQLLIEIPCDFFPYYSYTYHNVVVTAPDGTLHELFFDPVMVGTAVAADATNGVLKPMAFMDANGAAATIGSIGWEAGTVKVEVTPDDALADHILDIIELDGTVSLSLDVFDATVDAANDTLSWSVSTQPWEDGDLLMVRIHMPPPSCRSRSVVPDAGSEPALVTDCETLLGLRDAMAGTGTLNWGLDTVITSWDGVTVSGTPKRVTELDLASRSLTGVIPPVLGELTGLERLVLGYNQLTGGIPQQLGELIDLLYLDLSYNRLSGPILAELGSLSKLTGLWLQRNDLSGAIPSELGNLSKLEGLVPVQSEDDG